MRLIGVSEKIQYVSKGHSKIKKNSFLKGY